MRHQPTESTRPIRCASILLNLGVATSLLATATGSAADDEALGFAFSDFGRIAAERGWVLEKVVPVWLFAGFLHHGVELLFRLFKMRRRPHFPRAFEKAVIALDRLCFCLPLVKRIAWHYTAVYVKPDD